LLSSDIRAAKGDSVSDKDLKAAYQASLAEGAPARDKSEDKATPKDTDKENSVDKENDQKTSIIDETIISDLEKELKTTKEIKDKTDRPEINKQKETERRLAAAEEALAKIKNGMATVANEDSVQYSEEFYEALAKKHGVDPEQARSTIQLLEDGFSTGIKPLIENLQKEISDIKVDKKSKDAYSNLEKDKLFKVLKSTVDRILETDETVLALPPEQRPRQALKLAKAENIDLLIKVARKGTKQSVQENKRLIPSESSTVVGVSERSNDSEVRLTDDDLREAKKLGMTGKDIKLLGKTQTSFVEG